MMQRKNKSSTQPSNTTTPISISEVLENSSPSKPPPKAKEKIITATVHRPTFGTSPFAKYWLNVDCCGLVCAGLTYLLHAFGCYAFGWVLVPSGWRKVDEDGNVELSLGGIFHRSLFLLIAFLAVVSHFKAMTTDPGAVPPDANPLPDEEDLEWVVKGEQQHHHQQHGEYQRSSSGHSHSQHVKQPQALMQEESTSLLADENGMEDIDININSPKNDHHHTLHNRETVSTAAGQALAGVAMAAMAPVAVVGAGMAAMAKSPTSLAVENDPHLHAHAQQQQQQQQPMRGRRMCRRCKAFKPPRAHHCSICNRCIIKMDHHCPWVNNCVGIGNHKFFLLFIFYTSLSCMYSLAYIVSRMMNCVGAHPTMGRCVDHASDLLPLIGLTVEALLFGLFTICMMCDQWDVVVTNLTHIDRLKGEHHHQHGYYNPNNQHASNSLKSKAGVHEVFGARVQSIGGNNQRPRFHYSWISPFHNVCFPDPVRDDIFGYCRPCGGFNAANLFKSATNAQSSMEMIGRGEGRVIGAAEIV